MERQRLAGDSTLENKQTVRAFYEMAFGHRRPNDAALRFFVPTSPSSDPLAGPTSPHAHAASISAWLESMPRLEVKVLRLVAEGDLVVAHSHFTPAPGRRPMLVMDLFRLRAGRIVEHWDALHEVHGPGVPAG
ncbi:MAG: nuclear transport factor 2 family protein [Thermoplasmatota archaeon]